MVDSRTVVVRVNGATFDLIEPWAAEGKLPTFARLIGEGAHAELGAAFVATATRPALCAALAAHGKRADVDEPPEASAAPSTADLHAFRDGLLARQREHAASAVRRLAHASSDLVWIAFPVLATARRLFGHFMDRSHPAHRGASALGDTVLRVHQMIDEGLAAIWQQLGGRDRLVVVSDRAPCRREIRPAIERWLVDAGYLAHVRERPTPEPERSGVGGEVYALVRALRRSGWLAKLAPRVKPKAAPADPASTSDPASIDWAATRVYCTSTHDGALRVNLRDREPHGIVDWADYARLRDEVAEALRVLIDPATGRKLVAAVHGATTSPPMGSDPDLILEPTDAFVLGDNDTAAMVRADGDPSARRRSNGILLASGPGVRAGARVPALDACDVAPTLLYMLGLPVPAAIDGVVATALFEEAHLRAHPVAADRRRPKALGAAATRGARSTTQGTFEEVGYS